MLPSNLIEQIASHDVIDEAYRWLCDRREGYSHKSDVWTLRWHWGHVKPRLQAQLLAGDYRFESLHVIGDSTEPIALWAARDSLVQKAMAIVLTRHLAPLLPKSCHHLVGHGGVKGAIREVLNQLPGKVFVFRTDVKGYYAAIDHDILFAKLKEQIAEDRVLDLLRQYMRRTIYDAGRYEDVTRGIALGSPVSALMGAIYLQPLDEQMERLKVSYVRFMDDWVVLAPTRWKLRSAVKCVNETMAELKMGQHPDKTFVGRISRGFDFLGHRISPAGLIGLARQSVQQTIERINQLYEQGADTIRIGRYVRHWWAWVRGGLREKGESSEQKLEGIDARSDDFGRSLLSAIRDQISAAAHQASAGSQTNQRDARGFRDAVDDLIRLQLLRGRQRTVADQPLQGGVIPVLGVPPVGEQFEIVGAVRRGNVAETAIRPSAQVVLKPVEPCIEIGSVQRAAQVGVAGVSVLDQHAVCVHAGAVEGRVDRRAAAVVIVEDSQFMPGCLGGGGGFNPQAVPAAAVVSHGKPPGQLRGLGSVVVDIAVFQNKGVVVDVHAAPVGNID